MAMITAMTSMELTMDGATSRTRYETPHAYNDCVTRVWLAGALLGEAVTDAGVGHDVAQRRGIV